MAIEVISPTPPTMLARLASRRAATRCTSPLAGTTRRRRSATSASSMAAPADSPSKRKVHIDVISDTVWQVRQSGCRCDERLAAPCRPPCLSESPSLRAAVDGQRATLALWSSCRRIYPCRCLWCTAPCGPLCPQQTLVLCRQAQVMMRGVHGRRGLASHLHGPRGWQVAPLQPATSPRPTCIHLPVAQHMAQRALAPEPVWGVCGGEGGGEGVCWCCWGRPGLRGGLARGFTSCEQELVELLRPFP